MPKSANTKKFLSVNTIEERYDIPRNTLRDWIAQGTLPAYKVNGKKGRGLVRIAVEDLEALFARMSRGGQL